MPTKKDYTGLRFHELTVIREASPIQKKDGSKRHAWLCRCELCENMVVVSTATIQKQKSCGCLRRRPKLHQRKDITGQRFGKLVVIKRGSPRVHKNGKKGSRWTCMCDCGTTKDYDLCALTTGNTKSCGCSKKRNGGKRLDLIGQTFGRLTVVAQEPDRLGSKGNIRTFWQCECRCGSSTSVSTGNLTKGRVLSCGCYQKDRLRETRFALGEDITGRKFGKLTALERTKRRSGTNVLWLCQCSCGGTTEVTAGNLKHGQVISCGCIFARAKRTKTYDSKNKDWSYFVKLAANYTCVACGVRTPHCHAHHIKSYARFEELRTELSNGACMCEDCHIEFHTRYGKRKFTDGNYHEFVAQKKSELARN